MKSKPSFNPELSTTSLDQEIETIQQANDELSFLNELSETIGRTSEFEEIIKTIISKSIREVLAEQGSIILLDQHNRSSTLEKTIVTQGGNIVFNIDDNILGWMILNMTPLNLADPRNDNRFKGVRWHESIRSLACVPLLVKSALIGVLTVFNKQDGGSFQRDDLKLLTVIASQSAQLIENTRLYGVEQLHEEMKRKETVLLQSKKMAALGALVAGLAHEINNPLGAIHSSNDVSKRCLSKIMSALESQPAPSDIRDRLAPYLETLGDNFKINRDAIDRISSFVTGLKSFSQLDSAECSPVDLHEGLNSTLALLEHEMAGRITVKREFGDLPKVLCFAAEINQVFEHLLTNAIQAIEAAGTITIRTLAGNDTATIQITDTGCGIPKEQISTIFDPVFSRKGSRIKAGFGLFTCANIIEKHNGQIKAASKVGEGATFTITLPR